MHIEIHDSITFREIQEVFASHYPWLRLAFYKQEHRVFEGSEEEEALPPGISVGAFKPTHVSGLVEIHPLEKVQQLEREFQQRFGLPVQVLYKEKNAWVQTTGTDSFTLKELNELSRNASDEKLLTDYEQGWEEPEDTRPSKLM